MKNIAILFAAVSLCACPASARAESAVTIKAEVDRTETNINIPVMYKVVITASLPKISAPQLPKFEGFFVASQASSSTVAAAKGKLQSAVVYTFILLPKQGRKITIEPTRITVDGKEYASEQFEITVNPEPFTPSPEKKTPQPQAPASEREKTLL